MTTKEKPSEALVYNFPHSIKDVFKEITAEHYISERAEWVTTDEATATITTAPSGAVKLVLDRAVRRNFPKPFKGLFPDKQHMDHTEVWEPDGDGWKGHYDVDVKGAPVKVAAEYTLKKKGAGCELRIWHEVTAKIPLLGGRIEKYILGQSRSQFGDQLKYLDLKLAGTPGLLPRDQAKYPLPG